MHREYLQSQCDAQHAHAVKGPCFPREAATEAGESGGEVGELEERIEGLEEQTSGLSGLQEEICEEEGLLC